MSAPHPRTVLGATLAAVVAVALLATMPAQAQSGTGCADNAIRCSGTVTDGDYSPGGGSGTPGARDGERIWGIRLGPANALSQMLLPPGTTQCYVTEIGAAPGNLTRPEATQLASQQGDGLACPFLGGMALVTRLVEDSAPLPTPTPEIKPGKAVTGLPAFLETGLPESYGETLDLQIAGQVAYDISFDHVVVDWGDGTPPQTYDRRGVPYRDRNGEDEITHRYRNVGDGPCDDGGEATCYTVEVTGFWTFTATMPSGATFSSAGPIPGPAATTTIPVEQIQAVRNR